MAGKDQTKPFQVKNWAANATEDSIRILIAAL